MCVCVCVCERERERERVRDDQQENNKRKTDLKTSNGPRRVLKTFLLEFDRRKNLFIFDKIQLFKINFDFLGKNIYVVAATTFFHVLLQYRPGVNPIEVIYS